MTTKPLYGAIEAGGTKIMCAVGYGPTEIPEDARALIPPAAPGPLPVEARAGGFDRYITAPALGDLAGTAEAFLPRDAGERCVTAACAEAKPPKRR